MLSKWLIGSNFASSGLVTVTYIGEGASSSNSSSYSFSNQSIGTASSDRIVVIAVSGSGNSNIGVSSVSVNSSAATVIHERGQSFSSLGLYYIKVASGTTANIDVTFDSTVNRCSVDIFTVTGQSADAPSDSEHAIGDTTQHTVTLDIPSGAGAIYCTAIAGTGVSVTWSDATEQYEGDIGNESTNRAGAIRTTGGTGATETVTISTSSPSFQVIGAVWS